MLELVSGYQVFQQGGKRVPPWLIATINTQDGRPLYAHAASTPAQVYDVTHDSMMVHMMKKVVEAGTAKRAAFGPPVAGKTGTSQNWRDAWFIGFTTDYATGVWFGNDDDRPMNRVVGGDLPASTWRRFMIAAHKGLAVRDFDWLLPEVAAQMEPDPRNSFYETLGEEFAKQASDAAAAEEGQGPPTPAPEQVPY
jgi:penicillin-binding protein 1A